MDLGIKGKVALVTGANSGIGSATARELLEEGVTVVLTDKTPTEQAQVVEEFHDNKSVFYYPANIVSEKDLKDLHKKVADEVGKIDILVQNAGIVGPLGVFHEIDDDGWTETIEQDLFGPVRVIREFLPDLRTGGWGRIVLLASENGVQPYEDELPYNSAKAAILALSKGLSSTYAKEGLLVNAVSPAFIKTPMTDGLVESHAKELNISTEEAEQSILKTKKPHMTQGRRGTTEEAAAVIVFLCSDKASFVNGSNYRVDSGSVATI